MSSETVPNRFSEVAKYILHATDFSEDSEFAFAHALRLAVNNHARLSIMHVSRDKHADWDSFPSVRETLQRWGMLESGARRADVSKLGIEIEKINVYDTSNIVGAISSYLDKGSVDMLVLATRQRTGLANWLKPSTAEQVSRKMALPTLFVPSGAHGCVSPDDGHVTLDHILIPVDHTPPAGGAIERGLRALTAFGKNNATLTLLHVGADHSFPHVTVPEGPWKVVKISREGRPVTEILNAAEEGGANLIIMVTKGSQGFLDMLRGTTTEQVLQNAHCPVLSIPADF